MSSKNTLKEHISILFLIMHSLDIGIILISAVIASCIMQSFSSVYILPSCRGAMAFAIVIGLVIYPRCGIYQIRQESTIWNEVKSIFLSWSTLFISLIGIAFLLKESGSFSRSWVGAWYLCGLNLWIIERMAVRFTLRALRKRGCIQQQCIAIIGTGELAEKTADAVNNAPWMGLKIRGFYKADNSEPDTHIPDAQICGNLTTLLKHLNEDGMDQAWIALPCEQIKTIQKVIHTLNTTTIDIRLVPDLLQMRMINHPVFMLGHLLIINLRMTPMQSINSRP